MSDREREQPQPADGAPVRRKRTLLWVGVAGVAALVVSAGVAIPMVAQAQRVEAYGALAAQRDASLAQRAEAQVRLDAAIALAVAQRGESIALAERAVALGQAAEPVLSAERAGELTAAGEAAIEAIDAAVPAPAEDDDRAQLHASLAEAADRLRAEDEAALAAADAAGEEPPAPVAIASFLLLDVAGATAVLSIEPHPEAAETVADDAVTDEVIEQTQTHLADIERQNEALARSIADEEAGMLALGEALQPAHDALVAAAASATAQAAQIVEQTAKAPDASEAVTTSAQHAQELGADADAAQLLEALEGYVAAAGAAQTAHAEAVEAERAAAAAAEARAAEARAAAARQAAAGQSRGGTSNAGNGSSDSPRLCARYRPDWGGGGSLVLVPC
ncbi:coiled-coil domain-containing protein [Agrococcus baldri]|uniref:Uncharacterized protein n=1 Tax=Agrococcus baldri TaxID=153730 RepID=A0AA87RKY7_9MICO|nr:hypothetical protein [Agrococcus baldri]GEK81033.1 hypothetical protein ABA31_23840 [Agrococcus baldri]